MSLRAAWRSRSAGPRPAPEGPGAEALAEAAARRALAEAARLRDAGTPVLDEADFVAREIQQAFLDREAGAGRAS